MISFVGIAKNDKEVLLYYNQTKKGQHTFKVVTSLDGFEFSEKSRDVTLIDEKNKADTTYNLKSFRIAKQGEQYILTCLPQNLKTKSPLLSAISNDLTCFTKTGAIDTITETGTIVSDFKYKKNSVMYFGENNINIAYSPDITHWKPVSQVLQPRSTYFDNEALEVGNAYYHKGDILLIYYGKKVLDNNTYFLPGAAIFDGRNPTKLLWRSTEPLYDHKENLEKIIPLGSAIHQDKLILYWRIGSSTVFAVSCPIPHKDTKIHNKIFSVLFKKFNHNPIIAPRPDHPWESRATFNSAAVYEDGKVHFVYRALGDKDLSVLGYATSSDGVTIDERSEEPIYIPREPFETPGQIAFKTFADHFASGGGYGGIEDPRITKIDDRFYMTYVAFDGASPPRVALTSIGVKDFLNRRWDKWKLPKLISSPGMVNKNAVIFPEKIKGKYAIFHRVYPNILIDYVDDLKFSNSYLRGLHFIPPRKNYWDSKKIGAGAPPIKTKDGWLFIYQSVGYQDSGKYKVGAMLLDHDNPSKVITRTSSPIIEPVEKYENDGYKAGVVYPCGAVVMNNKLNVYYGGADTVVCAASTDLDRFLWEMNHNREPKLKQVKTQVF